MEQNCLFLHNCLPTNLIIFRIFVKNYQISYMNRDPVEQSSLKVPKNEFKNRCMFVNLRQFSRMWRLCRRSGAIWDSKIVIFCTIVRPPNLNLFRIFVENYQISYMNPDPVEQSFLKVSKTEFKNRRMSVRGVVFGELFVDLVTWSLITPAPDACFYSLLV